MRKIIAYFVVGVLLTTGLICIAYIERDNQDHLCASSIENRYITLPRIGSLSIYQHEYVKEYVIIRYPQIEGTEYDEIVNALIADYPSSIIRDIDDNYHEEIKLLSEWAKGTLLLIQLEYEIDVLPKNILEITYYQSFGGGMGNNKVKIVNYIDLKNGKKINLSDLIADGDRITNYQAKNYTPPNDNGVILEASQSFSDAFPNCANGKELLRDIDSGVIGWSLQDDSICFFSTDLRHGAFVYVPYSEFYDFINPMYRDVLRQ